jgi:hypothetical protein
MGPRSNFECHNCWKRLPEPELEGFPEKVVIYEDLPIQSMQCPVCGFKRGFRRRFDAVNVSTTGHRVAKILDPLMAPSLNAASRAKDDARTSAAQLEQDHARAIEMSPPPQRAAMRHALQTGPTKWLSPQEASAAAAAIPMAARMDSRQYIWPHIRRRVRPIPTG